MAKGGAGVALRQGKPEQDDIPSLCISKDMAVGHVAVGVEIAASYRVEKGSYV